jgi:hypothetical protein
MSRRQLINTNRTKAVYRNMISACENGHTKRSVYYYERNIKVCKRWLDSIDTFIKDVGVRNGSWWLMRIDVTKDYSPSNVEWVHVRDVPDLFYTKVTLVVGYKGIYLKAVHWCKLLGIPQGAFTNRRRWYRKTRNKELSFKTFIQERGLQTKFDKLVKKMDPAKWPKGRFTGATVLTFTQGN